MWDETAVGYLGRDTHLPHGERRIGQHKNLGFMFSKTKA